MQHWCVFVWQHQHLTFRRVKSVWQTHIAIFSDTMCLHAVVWWISFTHSPLCFTHHGILDRRWLMVGLSIEIRLRNYLVNSQHKQSICLFQLSWQSQASNGEAGVQPTFNAGAEEEAEGVPTVSAGFSGPASQEAPGFYPSVQCRVWLPQSKIRWWNEFCIYIYTCSRNR